MGDNEVTDATATLPRLLAERARAQPGSIAIVDDAGPTTYAELFAAAAEGATGLLAEGLQCGDRLAVQLPNGRAWAEAYWAGALAGLIVVPIDLRSRPAEVAAMTARSGASALLTGAESDYPDRVGETAVLRALPKAAAPDPAVLPGLSGMVGPGDVHFLQFTSGSTGLPKAAMLTHRGLVANCLALGAAWGLARDEALVVPSPLSHVLGFLAGCLVPVAMGATSLTMATFDPERALELIDEYRAVGMSGTPTHYLMLVEHPERSRYDTSSLRFAMYGGAPMTPDVAARITDNLGVQALLGGFGMSETSGGVTSVSPDDTLEVQLNTVGRPLPTFEVRIVDPASGQTLPDGEAGELWVRGAPVCVGYWADPEETARALTPDGWLRTGDLLVRRHDGCLAFAGRLKEIILVGGYTVSPGEIERVLTSHPAVAEAVVVGVPDRRLGEIPIAFVRRLPEMSVESDELEAYGRAQLASYKVPRTYVFQESFPVSATGKVERFKMREEAARLVGAGPGA